ncbi:MAG: NAD(P)/FAD-dependent oxidoreductase [Ignavibacteria bacterium]|jgi:hypothetical protein
MIKEIELSITPDKIKDYSFQRNLAAKKLKLNPEEVTAVQITRRSIDARKKPVFKIRANVYINEKEKALFRPVNFEEVKGGKRVVIVGCGPAGMFAALRLIELGIKPIIIERGKDVQTRRRDLKSIQQQGIVNPDSNYCFGEGGAGTYSDGKLYTRSVKRGNVKRILDLFVQHGAHEEILIDAHPHIGSNKLPKVVQAIRENIISCGGEIHFQSKLTDFILPDNKLKGVIVNNEKEIFSDVVILATGHSARDIFYLLNKHNILIEQKAFAMGVRIEHPQQLIDSIQYHSNKRHENLPASSYNISCRVDGKGVYSFCMCPGGIIIPASTDKDELVLNGMSVSRRDSKFANSGLVVSIDENDWKKYNEHGVFAGLELQKEIERSAFEAGGRTQTAPAQRITDFVNNKISSTLPDCSYIPGIVSSQLHEIIPQEISNRLQKSLKIFSKKLKGYFSEEGQVLAAETRTSSPIRIPRDNATLMHPQIEGLFPCGEGAGYAGGIVSAAIDGEKCGEAAVKFIL